MVSLCFYVATVCYWSGLFPNAAVIPSLDNGAPAIERCGSGYIWGMGERIALEGIYLFVISCVHEGDSQFGLMNVYCYSLWFYATLFPYPYPSIPKQAFSLLQLHS